MVLATGVEDASKAYPAMPSSVASIATTEASVAQPSIGSKSAFVAPQSGQSQSSGRS
jgi:hypothetical protein